MIDYTIPEVSSILKISTRMVRKCVAIGLIPTVPSNSSLRISKKDLDEFLKTQEKEGNVQKDIFGNISLNLPTEVTKRKRETPIKEDNVNWVDISDIWNNPPKQEFTFIDLFCGAGGLSKGLEMAGLKGICGLDWFKEAGETYRANFKHHYVEGDIKLPEVKKQFYDTIHKELGDKHPTIIAGGFPCQGFSLAGNRIMDDPRNSLYKEMLDIVKTLKPLYVICENVIGIRSMLGGRVEQKILDDFKGAGYDINVTLLRAADYYVPQKRDRVIFIGNRIGAPVYHPKPLLSPSNYVTVGQAIGDLMNHGNDPAFNHILPKHRPDLIERMKKLKPGEALYKGYLDSWRRCPWDDASYTVKENHGGTSIHPKLPRCLTPRELARLQSFPDDFIFYGPKTKQLVQIGNAVPPLLGKAIGLSIVKSIESLKVKSNETIVK